MPLEFDGTVWTDIVTRFARAQRTPAPSNRGQAEVPRGATILRNRWGTAPGLWLEGPEGLTIMLPGVPGEMRKLLEFEVAPRLSARIGGMVVRSLVVRTTAIPESTLAERMGDVEREIAPLTLAYLPGTHGVDLRLTAWRMQPAEADRRLREAADLVISRAGEHVYGEGDVDLAAVVLERARAAGLSLGAAESCTGGLVGGRLTDIPGSSDVFIGAVVCYANRLKTELLDVSASLIDAHGAVSEEVARAMAEGALRRLSVALAVAVTGIAGPGGGTSDKPVGTVWFAVASPGRTESRRVVFLGSRREIRERAAQTALYLLDRRLLAD
jgi:nicotinamide-nucleotide amidase